MAHAEQTTGFTIHKMDLDFDAGPIAVQKAVQIEPTDSHDDLFRRIISEATPEIVVFLQKLSQLRNDLPLTDMSEDTLKGTRCYTFPKVEDRKQFRRMGKTFFRYC